MPHAIRDSEVAGSRDAYTDTGAVRRDRNLVWRWRRLAVFFSLMRLAWKAWFRGGSWWRRRRVCVV